MDILVPPSPDDTQSTASDQAMDHSFLSPEENSSSSSASSQHSNSPRTDWAIPSFIHPSLDIQKETQTANLASLSLDMDFQWKDWTTMNIDPSLISEPAPDFAVDPNALHLDPSIYDQFTRKDQQAPVHDVQQLLTPAMNYSSTSSRCNSPMPPMDLVAGIDPGQLTVFDHLSQMAREATGVVHAVHATAPVTPISPIAADATAKLPIPRLPAHSHSNFIVSQTDGSQSLSTLTQSSNSSSLSVGDTTMPLDMSSGTTANSKPSRPKTSHTTIERRYRTNLNARILALKRAVPALRVLEKNTANHTQGKGFTGVPAGTWDFDDQVDERGYVDGVKAAKKNSKGIVLGKAAEYIRVLKRRELRLKREGDGLRHLISGLVGGPQLLSEWEREWREQFGGEEMDEVPGADERDYDGDDGEDGDGDDDSDDDRRPKKKAKVDKKQGSKAEDKGAPTLSLAPPQGQQAEKRKRGRPRKNPVPILAAAPAAPLLVQPIAPQQQQQPSKYLLSAFVLFNIFGTMQNSTPQSHSTHEGSVLGTPAQSTDATGAGFEVSVIVQGIHLIVSVLLFLSLVAPYLPERFRRSIPSAILYSPPSSTPKQMEAYRKTQPSAPVRADGGVSSVALELFWLGGRKLKGLVGSAKHGKDVSCNEADKAQWIVLGNREILERTGSSFMPRLQTYLALSRLLSDSHCTSDLITLALLAHSFSTSSAANLWASARAAKPQSATERLVLELDPKEASEIIAASPSLQENSASSSSSVVQYLARCIVLRRVDAYVKDNFIASVAGASVYDLDMQCDVQQIAATRPVGEIRALVAAGHELGGDMTKLVRLVDNIDAGFEESEGPVPALDLGDDSDESSSEASTTVADVPSNSTSTMQDIETLVVATALHRKVLTSGGASLPKETQLRFRRLLARPVFDCSAATEEARDRVVDLLSM